MIGVSNDYRRQLISGNRNWVIKVPVFLKGNTSNTPDFTLTNEHIWDNGIVLDEAISSDSSFDIGAAIVGSLKITIDNIRGNFSHYDFYDAKVTLYLGVEGDLNEQDVQRYYRIGFFVVDTPSYNGSLITLNCLDNMTWFDVPFDEITGITYPVTAGSLIAAICSYVGVILGTATFPNYTLWIQKKPEQKLNCREVLQYVAQKCCCYCKIDTSGALVLKWHDKNAIIGRIDYDGGTYDTNTTPYSDGCDLDGGWFHYGGDNADGGTFLELQNNAFISQNYDIEVSTDDVVITGVRVRNNTSKDDAYDELWVDSTLEQTHTRYVLVIDNNPFILKSEAANLANLIGSILAGLPVRGFTATSLADFSYETGDMATVIDFRGNRYYTWITRFTFTTNNSEQFSCGVESVRKRSEERFSGTVKTLAEANENAEARLSEYDIAVKAMNQLAANAIGYNKYEQTVSGATITYLYNGSQHTTSTPPKFVGSTVVFKISGDGVFVAKGSDIAADGTCTFSNGYDANSGTAILNLIYAIGLNAEWIKAGKIDVNRLNIDGIMTAYNSTGTVTINGGKITASTITGAKIASTTIDGGNIKTGAISAAKIASNAVTADKINVSTLSAITANMGTLTAGEITGGTIKGTTEIIADDAKITVVNGGYIQHKSSSSGLYQWQFDLGARYCNCMYYENGDWHWVNGGATEIYKYLEGAYSSDRRIKKNIKDIDVDFSKRLIMNTRPRSYRMKYDDSLIRYGVVAQEVKETLDNIGVKDKTAIVRIPEEKGDQWAVEYKQYIPHLINVVKSQQEEIDLLKQEVALLKEKVGV